MKCNRVINVVFFVISSMILHSYDSMLESIKCVDNAQKKQINGFQGCRNKAICGYYGIYLASYSPEGLCDTCEFNQFPERFVACLFCRQPVKKICKEDLSLSFLCELTIRDILEKNIITQDEFWHKEAISMGLYRYCKKLNAIERKFIPAFGNTDIYFKVFDGKKPGFYIGARKLENGNLLHIWSKKVNIELSDKKFITNRDEAEKHIGYIFHKYNLIGPETGTITEIVIPDDAVTYEEVIV